MAKILIVEDNPLNLRLLCEVLEHREHSVEIAMSVAQARERLQAAPPELVLLDVQIPGGGGEKLLQEIKSDPCYARVPVIAVTALAMAGDRQRLLELGFDGYFSKPIDTRSFGPAVESFLEGSKRT